MSFPFPTMALDLAGSSCCKLPGYLIDWRELMPGVYVAGIAGEERRALVLKPAGDDRVASEWIVTVEA